MPRRSGLGCKTWRSRTRCVFCVMKFCNRTCREHDTATATYQQRSSVLHLACALHHYQLRQQVLLAWAASTLAPPQSLRYRPGNCGHKKGEALEYPQFQLFSKQYTQLPLPLNRWVWPCRYANEVFFLKKDIKKSDISNRDQRFGRAFP